MNDFLNDFKSKRNDYVVLWAFSDIQPESIEQRSQYELALNDVLNNVSIDYGIVLGDMVHNNAGVQRGDYDWYAQQTSRFVIAKQLNYEHWIEIAGNHESWSIEEYKNKICPILSFSKSFHNILFLCMSDEGEAYSPEQEMSNATYEWWKEIIANNQNRILINITHNHALKGGLFQKLRIDTAAGLGIQGTRNMFNELKKHSIDLWLNGHTHNPVWFPRTIMQHDGIIYIDTAAIKKQYFYQHIESKFIYFKHNDNRVLIRTRWHNKNNFVKCFDKIYIMNKTFIKELGE